MLTLRWNKPEVFCNWIFIADPKYYDEHMHCVDGLNRLFHDAARIAAFILHIPLMATSSLILHRIRITVDVWPLNLFLIFIFIIAIRPEPADVSLLDVGNLERLGPHLNCFGEVAMLIGIGFFQHFTKHALSLQGFLKCRE